MAARMHAAPGGLHLLDLPAGILSDHVVPLLQPHQRAALSLASKAARRAVAAGVRELAFPGGRCCPAVSYALHAAFPGVRALRFTPSNLHEVMNVVPSLLMTMSEALPGLCRVVLHDRLPDDPSERRKCKDCNAWCNTYDLAAIVFCVHGAVGPRLRDFDFATHYISNAECMAIGAMTGARNEHPPATRAFAHACALTR
ncbi:MAG: hypothetical protein J3K34DRAFT_267371 [Monoraphidium minutum]|nr:MAG: hypothetical protein J3K34DRAFT_267371 [Monoraphidium minutum]